ncbi:oligosaccharide repeat unit polymerase [Bacillus sp. PAMC26568]|nr:oligosaccharide repeat unit polymerase [Bacillus sp. PAMC26568]
MIYIVLWFLTFILSTYLFKKVAGSLSLTKPNMVSIMYYYSLLLSSFIGSLLIVLKIDGNYMIDRLTNDDYRVIGFFWICYIMIILPLTMLVVSQLVGFHAEKEFHSYLTKPVDLIFKNSNDFFILFLGLSLLSIMSIVYTMLALDKIPIIEMFRGASDLGKLRIEASHNFGGNMWVKNIFAVGLTPILALIAYGYTYVTNQRRWRILFIVLFAGALFMSVYDLQKAPILFFILMFVLVNIFIGRLKLTWKLVFTLGGTAVVLIILLYVFVQNVTSLDQFLSYKSGPIGRIILSQIAPFYLHLDLFGQQIDFLNGKSLPGIALSLYDIDQVRSARMVMGHYFPERVEEGTAGVLNTLYAGEAYANFGYLGILFGTIYIGIVIQLVYITFIRLPKHPVVITLFVFFTVNFPRVVVGGFTDFLFNPFWIFISVVFLGSLLMVRVKSDFLNGFETYLGKRS